MNLLRVIIKLQSHPCEGASNTIFGLVQGILAEGESSVQLTSFIGVACFVKKVNNIFNS